MPEPAAHRAHAETPAAALRVPLLVLGVALALRVLHVLAIADEPLQRVPHGDGRVYLDWADRIRGGAWIGDGAFYQEPLYAYVVALVRGALGESLTALRLCQALVGALGAALLAVAGRRLGGPRVGLVAGLVLATWPPAIFHDGLVQKSALATLLVCAVLASAARPRGGLLLGALVGAWMLTRGEARLAAALLAAWLACTPELRTRTLPRYVAGLALVLAPALAHNVAASGEWVLTTAQSGPNLFIGNRAGSNGTYAPLVPGGGDARREARDARRLAEVAAGRGLTASEVSAHWTARTLDGARADPAGAMARLARKARLAASRVELADTDDLGETTPRSPVLRALAPWLHLGVLLPLALAGACLARAPRRWIPALLVAAAQLVALVLVYVVARYRLPLVPPLALLAAEGLVAAHVASRGRFMVAVAAASLGALAAWWPLPAEYARGADAQRLNEANALSELGEASAAEAALEELTRDVPELAAAWASLGLVRARAGRLVDAVGPLRRAHELAPADPRLAAQLGTLLVQTGAAADGAVLLRDAALADPTQVEVAANAALALLEVGRRAEALEVLRARCAAAPDDRGAALQFAWLLATARDPGARNGAEALALVAPHAAAGDAAALDVQAAALAAAGRFEEAAATAERAVAAARAAGQDALARAIRARAATYRAGQPFVE